MVNDQIGCITLASNLSIICWKLIEIHNNGVKLPKIMHYSESGICTWFDITKTIYEYALEKKIFSNNLRIIPISSESLNLPARRPNFSLLNSQKTYDLVDFNPPHWRKSIDILFNSLDYQLLKKLK